MCVCVCVHVHLHVSPEPTPRPDLPQHRQTLQTAKVNAVSLTEDLDTSPPAVAADRYTHTHTHTQFIHTHTHYNPIMKPQRWSYYITSWVIHTDTYIHTHTHTHTHI